MFTEKQPMRFLPPRPALPLYPSRSCRKVSADREFRVALGTMHIFSIFLDVFFSGSPPPLRPPAGRARLMIVSHLFIGMEFSHMFFFRYRNIPPFLSNPRISYPLNKNLPFALIVQNLFSKREFVKG